MSALYLDEIVAHHRERAHNDTREWRDRPRSDPGPSLRDALVAHRPAGISVIAEVKRKSPSRGWLAPDLDAAAVARSYVSGGASAVSVLTDETYFGGSMDDLLDVRRAVTVPVLRKDFTVSPNDVVDATDAGASAVLLIAAALSADELDQLLTVARERAIDALVEVHDAREARLALDLGATLVGVNQRDLRTFDVDESLAVATVAGLPSDVVAVAESGFRHVDAVARAAAAGFDAVLVGEQFVTAPDCAAAVAEFVGAPIGARS